MLVAVTIIVVALLFFWMVDQGGKRDTALKERQAVRQYELDYQQGQLRQLELQLKLAQSEERKLSAQKLLEERGANAQY